MKRMAVARTRAEILIGKALRDASMMALERYLLVGDATVPEVAGRQVARAMARAWTYSIKRASERVMNEVKDGYDLEAKAVLWDWLVAQYVRAFGARAVTNILNTTREQIVVAVDRGLQEGLAIDVIAKQMRETAPGIARRRAQLIAITETHSAAQYASLETARASRRPLEKVWNSAHDHRTRDFGEGDGIVDTGNHRIMNGVAVGLDDPFMVPNRYGAFDPMQFPGDQNAPIYQVARCRCALTYRRIGRNVA